MLFCVAPILLKPPPWLFQGRLAIGPPDGSSDLFLELQNGMLLKLRRKCLFNATMQLNL